MTEPTRIAIVVYPGFTLLDALGPYCVLGHLPGHRTVFVAPEAGPIAAGPHVTIAAEGLAATAQPEVVVVAGGVPAIAMARDAGDPVVAWLRAARPGARWVTSVCTGSLLLAAAGLLDGIEATSHWYTLDGLRDYGAVPCDRRVVEGDGVMTSAGVSAGIDMALLLAARLAGEHVAQLVQLDMEYAPEPPFAAGSPATAPAAVTAELRAMYDAMTAPR